MWGPSAEHVSEEGPCKYHAGEKLSKYWMKEHVEQLISCWQPATRSIGDEISSFPPRAHLRPALMRQTPDVLHVLSCEA
jgi:hypothetical protein